MPDNDNPHTNVTAGRDSVVGGDFAARDHITNTSYTTYVGPAPGQTRRSELPVRQPFFGREDELATIADALHPDSRSWGVLIDGPGGIGKTALAVEAGHRAPAEQFPTKIFLSAKVRELTPQGEQKLEDFMLPNYIALLTELARELGEDDIAKNPENERANIVRRALSDRHALIIIDNLETFDEQERVRVFQFLGRLPASCKAIVTSRRRTDIDARIIRLDRLSLEAAQLLIAELATRNKLLARATVQERQQLYEVTHGNPLLIKWLAGQLGRQGSQCRTIAEACRFIEAAPKGNDPLEYAFGDLLDTFTESETKVLAALAHFTQPARVEWIAELADLPERAAETALEDLTDRALLISNSEFDEFLLPPLAAAFLRRMRPEVVTETGQRLADSVYALVLENGYKKFERFPTLEAEWPRIAAAFPLVLLAENDRLQRLCDALFHFLNFTGRWDESSALNQQAEEKAISANDRAKAGLRAYQAGWAYHSRGQAIQVLASAARAESHWRDAGAREKAYAIRLRGLGHEMENNQSAAIAAYKKSLDLFRTLALESEGVAMALSDLAGVERRSGDYDASERDYREALQIAKRVDDREGVAVYTSNLAFIALNRKEWFEAESLAREALSHAEGVGHQRLIASDCCNLAIALSRQDRKAEGLPYAQRAVEIYTKLRWPKLEVAQAVLRECEGDSG